MGEPLPMLEALRVRRRALGLSVRAVSERAGASASAVAAWERGDRCPPLERVCAYAASLGLTMVAAAGTWVPVPVAACVPDGRRPPVLRQLRATRLARDIPAAQVASALGVTEQTLRAWENGLRRIHLGQAHAYADVLGLVLAVEEISPSVTALVEAGGCPSLSGAGPTQPGAA